MKIVSEMDIKNKIKSREEMAEIRRNLDAQQKRVVFTNGCFDIIHRGHVEYLSAARNLGDVLILGLNSDDSVRRLKGEIRPLVPQYDRAMVMAALQSVDYVVVFDEDTPAKLIAELLPDILVKGGDYRLEDIVGRDSVEANGGSVRTIPFVEGRSSTNIIETIVALAKAGRID